MIKRKSKIISDIFLNIIAAGIVVLVLQLSVYPGLNKEFIADKFGNILVMMSVVNIIAVLFGNSLNNIRLIYDKEYTAEKVSGDFSILLLISGIMAGTLVSLILFATWPDEKIIDIILLAIISLLIMLRSYMGVEYRIKLNYKKILSHSIVYVFGLAIGTYLIKFSNSWPLVFLIGELFSFVYLLFTTNILKEPLRLTPNFRKVAKQYIFLSISSLLANTLNYLDRFVILLFLGAHSVAIFFAATIVGKMAGFVLSPISGVILSYISAKKEKLSLKMFILINILLLCFSIAASSLTYYISKPILKHLYFDLYTETFEILFLSNLAVILQACSSIPQIIILKYSSSSNQILIQLIYGIAFVVGGITLINVAGLKGFCIAAIIAVVIKIIFIFIIGIKNLRIKEVKSEP